VRAANIKTSKRLQDVLAMLEDGQWHTSLELSGKLINVAIGTSISELRHNGYGVESNCRGKNENGRTVWQYRLVSNPAKPDNSIGEAQKTDAPESGHKPITPAHPAGQTEMFKTNIYGHAK